MQSFQEIFERAAARHGGAQELEARLPRPKTKRQLSAMPDHRYLAAMTKSIFRSGFVWRVVEAKWPGFEEAFHGFEPEAVAALGPDEVTELVQDKRIIRNRAKIESVLANAELVLEESARNRGFGRFLAAWPDDDVVGLWLHLRQTGKRLGGDTGPMFLREVGKDTFMLRPDVVAVLVAQGVVAKKPTGKRDLAAAQDAFNAWREESGRPLCQISRVLAMSHGDVYDM